MRRALIGSAVMDHVWQIGHLGPPENEMLEAYTTLGYVAGKTERVRLLTAVVTAVVYRDPGLLAKAVTTLDVLSGGRAMLGIQCYASKGVGGAVEQHLSCVSHPT
jgi:alkanesulfonate monooxygenase SsuD/methylene tetrahydromethanopterin reductase-like flavin-dependent oxidoreductase (luciferase family)